MKDYLEKVINAKTEEVENIRNQVKSSESADEVRSLGETLDKVLSELNDAKEQLSKLDNDSNEEPMDDERAETKKFKCTECGYIYEGENLPEDYVCPECGAGIEKFEEITEDETTDEEDKAKCNDKDKRAEGEEEPTSEDVQRSANWVKVDANNLKKVASFEERGGNKMNEETRTAELKEKEQRGIALKEGRAITVASSDILLPKHQSSDLATAPFRQVSSFVDLTKIRNLQGGESYEAPYVKSYGEGGLTEEGADYTEAETEFGKAQINKVKITAYAEISEELEKLPAADYESEVRKGVEIALKKKMAKEQINGTGASNSFVGITSTNELNTAVLTSDDLELSTIDQDTLNNIIFSYGGDEEVEQKGVIVLNKADLLAFSLVKNEIGDHAYKIDLANQTINTVPYVINSNCKALSASTTSTGEYAMFYGIPQHYETAIFSPVDIQKSYDYKFKQGMIAYKASVFAGGNTTSYRGFMRIKKANPSA